MCEIITFTYTKVILKFLVMPWKFDKDYLRFLAQTKENIIRSSFLDAVDIELSDGSIIK